jgi:hypothetical protein
MNALHFITLPVVSLGIIWSAILSPMAAAQDKPKIKCPLTIEVKFSKTRMPTKDPELTVTVMNHSPFPVKVMNAAGEASGLYFEFQDAKGHPVYLHSIQNEYRDADPDDFKDLAPHRSISHKYRWTELFDVIPKEGTQLRLSALYAVTAYAHQAWGDKVPNNVCLETDNSRPFAVKFSKGRITIKGVSNHR